MAERIFRDLLSDLKEMETKVGRKTPKSLLTWVSDAGSRDSGDKVWKSDVADSEDRGSGLSDRMSAKINHLKKEMRWLRCADVRILCQLLSVHEGIEAMRWLMEDRVALASRGSSLAGSLSSLGTVEESGLCVSPCRDSPSPTCLQDLTESMEEEQERMQPPLGNNGDSDQHMLNAKHREAIPFRPYGSKFGAGWCIHASHMETSTEPASSQESQALETSPLQSIRTSAKTIRRALLRSSRVRKEVTEQTSVFIFPKQSDKQQSEHQTQELARASQNITVEEDDGKPSSGEGLLDYDAQWYWVESQDDVTFL